MRTASAALRSIPLLLAASACAHATPSASPAALAEIRASIEATNARFSEAVKHGDAEAVAQLFAEDGEAIPAAGKAFVSGRPALRDYYAARMRGTRFLEVVLTTVSVETSGDLAWETGTNRLTVQAGDAPPVTRTGRYLAVWRRQADGVWRIRVEAVIPDPPG
jgi:uncharacterized protein (TIGR02246 family)